MVIGRFIAVCVAAATASAVCAFEILVPSSVPVERLIHTTERQVRAQPKSAEAHYTLGRLHYLVFSTGCLSVSDWSESKGGHSLQVLDRIPDWPALNAADRASFVLRMRAKRARELAWRELGIPSDTEIPSAKRQAMDDAVERWEKRLELEHWEPATSLKRSEMVDHAVRAVEELNTAAKIDPSSALYLLTLAGVTEQAADWCEELHSKPVPKPLQELTYEAAKQTYLRAYNLAYASESKLKYLPDSALLSREAAEGYLRLARGKADPPSEAETIASVQSGLDRLGQLKEGPDSEVVQLITPIVFSLRRVRGLSELTAPRVVVAFDLRGYRAQRQNWHWVGPDTAILVWDPDHEGRITSGCELFGNYTFQVFRRTGYDALAALDDNGDGVLTGPELRGIRVWIDRNQNGRCDPGEVSDLDDYGIVGLDVRATGYDGISPTSSHGVIFEDGHTLPSWDWVAESAGRW